MALEDVRPVLSKDFTFVRIDTDRMIGGDGLLKRFGATGEGIPWFAFLDGSGSAIVTSTAPKGGNIGYPGEERGASWFRQMLEKVAKRMTAAEIDALVKSAIAFRDAKLPPG